MEATVQDWLNDHFGKIPGIRHGLVLLGTRGGQSLPAAVWPPESRPPIEVYAAARDTLLGKLPMQRVSPSETSHNRIFSMPIRLGDRSAGALAIAVDPVEAEADDLVLTRLRQGLARLYPLLNAMQSASPGSSEALRLYATALSQPDFAQACTAFANELAAIFHCNRVSIGLNINGTARVTAVSHGSGVIEASEAYAEVEAAMEEAMDQGAAILYPLPKDAKPKITLAHAALARTTQGSILSLPLIVDARVEGAITLEGPGEAAFNADELSLLEHLATLLAPLLILKRRAGESAWQRLRSQAGIPVEALRTPGLNRIKTDCRRRDRDAVGAADCPGAVPGHRAGAHRRLSPEGSGGAGGWLPATGACPAWRRRQAGSSAHRSGAAGSGSGTTQMAKRAGPA
jgi:hypothetical protein